MVLRKPGLQVMFINIYTKSQIIKVMYKSQLEDREDTNQLYNQKSVYSRAAGCLGQTDSITHVKIYSS